MNCKIDISPVSPYGTDLNSATNELRQKAGKNLYPLRSSMESIAKKYDFNFSNNSLSNSPLKTPLKVQVPPKAPNKYPVATPTPTAQKKTKSRNQLPPICENRKKLK